MRFSQRKGLKPIAEVIQTDSMNSELRNSLWNALDVEIWSSVRFVRHGDIDRFSKALWSDFFKEPIDSRPGPSDEIRNEFEIASSDTSGLKCMTFSNSLSSTTRNQNRN